MNVLLNFLSVVEYCSSESTVLHDHMPISQTDGCHQLPHQPAPTGEGVLEHQGPASHDLSMAEDFGEDWHSHKFPCPPLLKAATETKKLCYIPKNVPSNWMEKNLEISWTWVLLKLDKTSQWCFHCFLWGHKCCVLSSQDWHVEASVGLILSITPLLSWVIVGTDWIYLLGCAGQLNRTDSRVSNKTKNPWEVLQGFLCPWFPIIRQPLNLNNFFLYDFSPEFQPHELLS